MRMTIRCTLSGPSRQRADTLRQPPRSRTPCMPSHIFTRLGYWDESAATNERAWQASESDVKRAGEPGTLRDFHSLNYLQYAYLQLGRYRDARHTLDIIAAQYNALIDKKTAPDTPELQSRHVRGRTIYAIPDRFVYGSL